MCCLQSIRCNDYWLQKRVKVLKPPTATVNLNEHLSAAAPNAHFTQHSILSPLCCSLSFTRANARTFTHAQHVTSNSNWCNFCHLERSKYSVRTHDGWIDQHHRVSTIGEEKSSDVSKRDSAHDLLLRLKCYLENEIKHTHIQIRTYACMHAQHIVSE